MTAFQIARQWHRKYVPETPFEHAVVYYIDNGLFHATPHVFIAAEQCHWDGEEISMNKDFNAWFVYMAAATEGQSPIREMVRVAPNPQEWVVWSRNNSGLRAYRYEHLARKVGL